MPAKDTQLLVDPYSRSGPYGELLGCALGTLKTGLISRILKNLRASSLRETSLFINEMEACISNAIDEQERTRNQYIEILLKSWPRIPDTEEKDRLRFAIERFKQLRGYMLACRNTVRLANSTSTKEEVYDHLAKLCGALFWPYYFTTIPCTEQNSNCLVTWMPPATMLGRPCFGIWPDAIEVETPFPLYPTAYDLFQSSDDSTKRELVALTSAWLDLGYSNNPYDSENQDLNIGHVQSFWDLDGPIQYAEDLKELVVNESRESTLFSDAFYLNNAALYIDDHDSQEGEVPVGRLIICTPVPEVIRLLGKISTMDETQDNEPKRLGNLAIDLWHQQGGSQLGRDIHRRYLMVSRGLLVDQAELDEERIQSFIAHTVIGPAADALSYISSLQQGRAVEKNTSRVRHKIETLLRNANTLLTIRQLNFGGTQPVTLHEVDLLADCVKPIVNALDNDRQLRSDLPDLEVHVDVQGTPFQSPLPNAVSLLLSVLIHNAVEELDAIDDDCVSSSQLAERKLEIKAVQEDSKIVVEVRNSSRPGNEEVVCYLNRQLPQQIPVWRLSRKGASHYHIGSRKVKWMAHALGGEIKYNYEQGEFVAYLSLPIEPVVAASAKEEERV